jgi:hypothetical protein
VSQKTQIGERTRKKLKRWTRGGYKVSCHDIRRFRELGLIERVSGNAPGGGYVSYDALTIRGRRLLLSFDVSGPTQEARP